MQHIALRKKMIILWKKIILYVNSDENGKIINKL